MLQLKLLSKDSIAQALIKAKHYRLLNEPWQAESICRDILNVEPTHQITLLNLILAITDQFGHQKKSSYQEARELCAKLSSNYEQLYYRGLIEERLGKVALARTTPRAKYIAYEHYRNAMEFYEKSEKIHREDNQDSILRWNACVRRIQEFDLKPSEDDHQIQAFLDV